MSSSSRFFSVKEFLAGFLVLLVSAAVVTVPRWVRLYQSPALATEKAVDVYLEQELDVSALIEHLSEKELLRDPSEFKWAVRTLRWSTFREGHYRAEKGISYDELLSKMGKGLQDPIQLMVLPGLSEKQLIQSISKQFQFDSLSLRRTLADSLFLAEASTDTRGVIGRLYPATYQFYWTASAQKVIGRLIDTFEQNISSKYSSRLTELDRSLNEILALASIIEWEAKDDQEKDIISGLYWNRLRAGMKLQADPTVNYAVGQRRRLTYKDYKVQHPYNTYLHAGLPPGPINNPSQSSIEAALFPEDHDYLYMVASPDGTHNFSKTYNEHLRKSEEWRRWLEKQYRIKRQKQEQSKDSNG